MSPTVARIVSLIFILAGGALLFFGARSLRNANASKSWPTAPGKIVSSAVGSTRGNQGKTMYDARVSYEFSIAGQTHSSKDVAFGSSGSSDSLRTAQTIVDKYPAESAVTVHYSPSDPTTSVLEVGITVQTFLLPAFGAVFFLAGVGMLIFLPGAIRRHAA